MSEDKKATGPNLEQHGQALWERLVKTALEAQKQAEADPVRYKMAPMDMGVITAHRRLQALEEQLAQGTVVTDLSPEPGVGKLHGGSDHPHTGESDEGTENE